MFRALRFVVLSSLSASLFACGGEEPITERPEAVAPSAETPTEAEAATTPAPDLPPTELAEPGAGAPAFLEPPGPPPAPEAVLELPDGLYALRFRWPWVEGERGRLVVTVDELSRQELGRVGEEMRERSSHREVELAAEVEVLAVDVQGEPLERRVTVERFTVRNADARTVEEVLPEGTTFRWLRGRDAEADGVELSPAQQAMIRLALTRSGGPISDFVAQPRRPTRVGDEWSLDAERLRDAFTAEGAPVGAEIEGEATLLEVEPIDGVDCLHAQVRTVVHGVELPDLPIGAQVTEGRATNTQDRWVPVDLSGRERRMDSTNELMVRAVIANPAGAGRLAMRQRQERRVLWAPAES